MFGSFLEDQGLGVSTLE